MHYSLWLNGKVYHWGNRENGWKMYGDDESDREITREWKSDEKFNGIYFTMYTYDDLNTFCDLWASQNEFKNPNDSLKFIEALAKYMELKAFIDYVFIYLLESDVRLLNSWCLAAE